MSSKPLVSLKNAGVQRGQQWLVRGIDLDVFENEVVTLVGPNGSGKSTSVKMLLGIIKPDEGKVVRGKKLITGYVPQKLSIDWSLPLNVERFMRLTSNLSDDDLNCALERTGVLALKKSQMRMLSGGEFQRVLLARTIAKKPDLLVLDEPLQGVDFSGQISLYELISDIRKELKCSILMISHDLHVVMAATDRVICLNGHVCCQGTPDAVAGNPAYQDLFGQKAASTLALYSHQHDHTHLDDGTVLHSDGTITDTCQHDEENDHDGHSHKKEGS